MKKLKGLKFLLLILLAPLTLFLFRLPVGAIGGSDIKLSSNGAGMPDMELSSDGTRLAVVYYKQDSITDTPKIYLKSATANSPSGTGWVSLTFIGYGGNPQVAFKRGVNNVVYVVWVNSSNTAIQSARCTLNSTTQPTCTTGNSVRTTGTGTLNYPDLVVDGNNVLHVAWLNGNIIEMTRATVADSVTAWPSSPVTPGLCGGGKAEAPVLGWTSTSSRIHLAFLCGSASVPATSVEYRRSADDSPFSADVSDSFAIIGYGATADDQAISSDHSRLSNLAMTAGSAQVSLVWDGLRSGQNFGLMSITSTDEGSNWPTSGSRWYARYVPSGGDAYNPGGTDESKLSTTSTVPPQEYGLRPSLVISGTAGNAAVVWQQRRGDTCSFGESSSSDIYFAYPQTSVISDTLEHTDPLDYSIDPDLIIGPGGVRHFVFMKDNTADGCMGGITSDYAIYYRGPFTEQTNDSDFTNLYVKNDTSGIVSSYTVYDTPEGNITCSNIPAGTTTFCGRFTPGTYNVSVNTTQCGSASGQVAFSAGDVTRQVSCNGTSTYSVYLPVVLKPLPTNLYIKNNTTGAVSYTVYSTPEGNITCSNIPAGTTAFCGSFTPGTYQVRVIATACKPPQKDGELTFGSGDVTREVRCQ